MRELLREIARFRDSAEAASRARFQPSKHAHLSTVGELAAKGGQVIRGCSRYEMQGFQAPHRSGSRKVKHDIGAIEQLVFFVYLDVDQTGGYAFDLSIECASRVASFVGSREQVGCSPRVSAIGLNSSIDERLDLGKA